MELTVKIPRLITSGVLNSGLLLTVELTVKIPKLLSAIVTFNGWSIFTVELTVQMPNLSAIGVFTFTVYLIILFLHQVAYYFAG